MKAFFFTLLAIPIAAGLILWGSYNSLINKDEAVMQTYAQIQNVLQRQAELIPPLVETVKGSANFEQATLTKITEARAAAQRVAQLPPSEVANNPEAQKQMTQAMNGMTTVIAAVKEAYPRLQSVGNFARLFVALEGSQNRITTERRRNQLAVQDYNRAVRGIPTKFVADYYKMTTKPYYEAPETSQTMPTVKF